MDNTAIEYLNQQDEKEKHNTYVLLGFVFMGFLVLIFFRFAIESMTAKKMQKRKRTKCVLNRSDYR